MRTVALFQGSAGVSMMSVRPSCFHDRFCRPEGTKSIGTSHRMPKLFFPKAIVSLRKGSGVRALATSPARLAGHSVGHENLLSFGRHVLVLSGAVGPQVVPNTQAAEVLLASYERRRAKGVATVIGFNLCDSHSFWEVTVIHCCWIGCKESLLVVPRHFFVIISMWMWGENSRLKIKRPHSF